MFYSKKFVSATREYSTLDKNVPAPYLRRNFIFHEVPQKATITVCGLGFYRIFVNGNELTRTHLAPYIVNSHQVLPYDAYDITNELVYGENTIAFMLGNGMQNCLGGFIWDFDSATFRSAPKLAFALEVVQNGETVTYEADENLLCMPSPMYFDDFRMGVKYDARKEIPDWNLPTCDISSATPAIKADTPNGEAMLVDCLPIRVTREIKPVSIWKEGDSYIYDFGENCSGLTRLSISGKYGQKVIIDHGEWIDEGKFTQRNILFPGNSRSFDKPKYTQRTEYICHGGSREEFVPSFTYYGFRYAKVSGITEEQATEDLLTYLVMNSDFTSRGDFSSSCETLNTLYQMTRRATLANFFHIPTDCPHREKNGWTADAALSAEHTLLNFNAEDNYLMWLRTITRAMNHEGALPGIVPTGGWGFEWGNGPAWDSVLIYLPYFMAVMRDDLRGAEEVASSMLRYFQYLRTKMDENGLLAIGLGDWCHPNKKDMTPLIFTDSVVSYDLARKAEYLYHRLGLDLEESFCKGFADKIYESIRKHLLVDNKSMRFLGNSQTAQAMAIFYGLCETEEEKKLAFDLLLKYIHENDDHMYCGVLGGRVIFRVLCDFGYQDLAYKMIVRPDAPSYGYMIERGYTALAEDIFIKNASFNHHFWGDIAALMIEYFVGIRFNPTLNNINEVLIAPVFVSELNYATASHKLPGGNISVEWRREGESIVLTYSADKALYVTLQTPAGYQMVKTQENTFVFTKI